MKCTILALALLATMGAADASKRYTTQKATQTTTQSVKVEGVDVLTQHLNLEAARSPALVVGQCLGSMSLGMANNGWSFSFGTSKRLRACEERELAMLLIFLGGADAELGHILLRQQFNAIQRARKVKYTCRRPVREHCSTGARVAAER